MLPGRLLGAGDEPMACHFTSFHSFPNLCDQDVVRIVADPVPRPRW